MEVWRLLDYETDSPYMNLAVEESVARNVGSGATSNTIRFWRNPSSVVLGLSQRVESEVELDVCRSIGACIVRRFTGGGAVYQDPGNLNFSISVRKGHPLMPDDIAETYEVVAKGVIRGLMLLGFEAKSSSNEIQLESKKVSGMAGANEFGAVFRHGTLLVYTDPSVIYRILKNIKREVTTLNVYSERALSMNDVEEALVKGFETEYGVELRIGELSGLEMSMARLLYTGKYSSSDWNYNMKYSPLIFSTG